MVLANKGDEICDLFHRLLLCLVNIDNVKITPLWAQQQQNSTAQLTNKETKSQLVNCIIRWIEMGIISPHILLQSLQSFKFSIQFFATRVKIEERDTNLAEELVRVISKG